MPAFAVVGGTVIFVGFWVLVLFVVAFSYYTRRGSGINAHPNDGADGAPGAAEPGTPDRPGRMPESPDDRLDGGITTHGTK